MSPLSCRCVPVVVVAMIGLTLAAVDSRGGAETAAVAERPAVSFTGASLGFDNRFLTIGWVFSTDTDLLVDALGYYDCTGAGLKAAHQVGIFDNHGLLMAATTVAAGTKDPLLGSFRYAPIPPVTLAAGEVYTIAGTADTFANPNGYDLWGRDAVGLKSDPAVTIPVGAGRFEPQKDASLIDPTRAGGTNLYAGPNFLIADSSSAALQPGRLLIASTHGWNDAHCSIGAPRVGARPAALLPLRSPGSTRGLGIP